MASSDGGLSDERLDALLREAAAAVPYPSTPPLRPSVLAALEATRRGREPRARSSRRRLALGAAAALLAVVLASVVALPGPRTAVAEFFGIVEGQRVDVLPPGATPASAPTFVLADFAREVTLERALDVLPFAPALPAGAREPEGVYLVRWGGQPLLILHYAAFDLWQTRGSGFFGKGVPADAVLAQPAVGGRPAWWIASAGHATAFYDADGHEVLGSRRAVDRNALIWRGEATFYRMETELPLEQALAIAETLP